MSMDYSSDAEYLLTKLREEQSDAKEYLAAGNAKDYAEYRQLCGLIRGLGSAEQLIIDLAKRREKDADE